MLPFGRPRYGLLVAAENVARAAVGWLVELVWLGLSTASTAMGMMGTNDFSVSCQYADELVCLPCSAEFSSLGKLEASRTEAM